MEEGELKAALYSGNISAIDEALKSKNLVPEQRMGRDGFTLLHWTSYYGQKEVLNVAYYSAGGFHPICYT